MKRMQRHWLALAAAAALAALPFAGRASSLAITNLVADDQTVNAAHTTDPALVNPWVVSYCPTSPFWVSANETGLSTL